MTFTLERNWGHYVIDFFVPAALLVGLSWMSFWFDPTQVAGRISLGSLNILSLKYSYNDSVEYVDRIGSVAQFPDSFQDYIIHVPKGNQ